MKRRLTVMLGVASLIVHGLSGDGNRELYTETKSTVQQWVETENLISEERNQWKEQEVLLSDTLALLTAKKATLEEKLKEIESSASIADEKRTTLLDEKDDLDRSRQAIQNRIGSLEGSILEILPYMPDSFTDGAKAAIRRIPEDSATTKQSLSHRMRNIVALMSLASKFDNTISLEREVRDMADGSSKEVSTLYFGFAIAYFADPTGEYSGYGYPTKNGWKWEEDPEYAVAALDAIAMYEKQKQAAFVTLPVTIN